MNFTATSLGNNMWAFTGDVQDAAPAGLTVYLGGLASLQGVTAVTDATGHFSVDVILKADGSDTGTATAQTTDSFGIQSNVATCVVNP